MLAQCLAQHQHEYMLTTIWETEQVTSLSRASFCVCARMCACQCYFPYVPWTLLGIVVNLLMARKVGGCETPSPRPSTETAPLLCFYKLGFCWRFLRKNALLFQKEAAESGGACKSKVCIFSLLDHAAHAFQGWLQTYCVPVFTEGFVSEAAGPQPCSYCVHTKAGKQRNREFQCGWLEWVTKRKGYFWSREFRTNSWSRWHYNCPLLIMMNNSNHWGLTMGQTSSLVLYMNYLV